MLKDVIQFVSLALIFTNNNKNIRIQFHCLLPNFNRVLLWKYRSNSSQYRFIELMFIQYYSRLFNVWTKLEIWILYSDSLHTCEWSNIENLFLKTYYFNWSQMFTVSVVSKQNTCFYLQFLFCLEFDLFSEKDLSLWMTDRVKSNTWLDQYKMAW